MRPIRNVSLGVALLWCMTSQASPIFYTATDLADDIAGEDLWRYDYEVANTTGFDIGYFAIYFDIFDTDFRLISDPFFGDEIDPADYTTPLGWSGTGLPHDFFFGDEGQFIFGMDAGLFGPTSAANAVPGFSVTFIWNGLSGVPTSQFFEYFDDPEGFIPVGSSFTQLREPPQSVPEPGNTALLIGLGLLALAVRRRRTVPIRDGA